VSALCLFIFPMNPPKESHARGGWGVRPHAPNLEPDRAGSRCGCRPVPPPAAARKAGDVSTRHFLRFDRSSNLRVGGCERRCASRSLRSRRLLASPSRRATHNQPRSRDSTRERSEPSSPSRRASFLEVSGSLGVQQQLWAQRARRAGTGCGQLTRPAAPAAARRGQRAPPSTECTAAP
jgi:hypothetical protein